MGVAIESRRLSVNSASSDDKSRSQPKALNSHGTTGSHEPRSRPSKNGYRYRISGAEDTLKRYYHHRRILAATQTVPMQLGLMLVWGLNDMSHTSVGFHKIRSCHRRILSVVFGRLDLPHH